MKYIDVKHKKSGQIMQIMEPEFDSNVYEHVKDAKAKPEPKEEKQEEAKEEPKKAVTSKNFKKAE